MSCHWRYSKFRPGGTTGQGGCSLIDVAGPTELRSWPDQSARCVGSRRLPRKRKVGRQSKELAVVLRITGRQLGEIDRELKHVVLIVQRIIF